jgi:hypothetical protein
VKNVRHDTFVDNDIPVVWISLCHLDHLGKYPTHATQVADAFCTFQ